MSTAGLVRERIDGAPMRSFLAASDLPGSRRGVECELSRLVAKGELARVRKGLYWKAEKTRVGMALPRPVEVALAIAGPGAGLAGLSAAAQLGLTTQVPAVDTVAVPGRVPTAPPGTRFVSRSFERRVAGLRPVEVALIEVLRDGPTAIESPWPSLGELVGRLADEHAVRTSVISTQLEYEHHVAARQRWSELS